MKLLVPKRFSLFAEVFLPFLCLTLGSVAASQTRREHEKSIEPGRLTLSLAGEWRFALDPGGVGIEQKWFAKELADTIRLPGTTDENHKGIKKDEHRTDRLSRVWYWKGPAWYQRCVTVPESWRGKRITLFFERSKHTRVWADSRFCGWEDTLSAPQVFDLTAALDPGEHTITVLVDNARVPPVGPAHALDERTQTNWNGIIGKIELRATDPVWLDEVQVYPDAAHRRAAVHIVVGNITGIPVSGCITVDCESYNVPKPTTFQRKIVDIRVPAHATDVRFTYTPRPEPPLWSEFTPAMLCLKLHLQAKASDRSYRDDLTVSFGMRDFTRQRNRFLINGTRAFLRGNTECCIFPLTGYPPMEKAGWVRVFSVAKSYGLNHYRFHSWCPPEAAFQAADELGMYLQVELPNKRSGFNPQQSREDSGAGINRLDLDSAVQKVSLYDYAKREGKLILKTFGNHPSFVMFTLGNELGRNRGMFELVSYFKSLDGRHLYAQGSNNVHWNPSLAEGDDFWVTCRTAKDLPVRGAFATVDYSFGHIEYRPPSTMVDYLESICGVPVPVVSHELGEFQVYPDYSEIPEYTGVLKARNLEAFRESLREAGMLDQARDFVRASGALAAICYREDIEAALRTPCLGGFQLLALHDFPGQGTAPVGMLNAFMESKGVIAPEVWRQFCCETVPLLRMKKYTWTTDETFVGRVQVAHYGPRDLTRARVSWRVSGAGGEKIAAGSFPPLTLKQGKVCDIDMWALPLSEVRPPQKLTISLAIEGTSYKNDYPIWVYPPEVDRAVPQGVILSEDFTSAETQKHLAEGGKVLLIPKLTQLPYSIEGAFQSDFWSPMFHAAAKRRGVKVPPATLGILCNPSHPALAAFPTEFHSNWQWWHLVKNSRPIILDNTPKSYRPIVQVIDTFARNHKLGLIFQTKVGKGALLVCAIDLLHLQDKPEARQLLHSLLKYVGSPDFSPAQELPLALLKKLFPGEGSLRKSS